MAFRLTYRAIASPTASLMRTVPPQTRPLLPSARASAMLVYVRLGCPVVVSVNVCGRQG
jgi:hypothetical protein